MTSNNSNIKKQAITPLITTILLVVVAVILVTLILSFGKDFTTKSLDKTNNLGDLKVSDASLFVYPKETENGVLQVNYSPPANLENETVTITQYKLIDAPDSEVVTLETPVTLTNNTLSIISLDCLYEYSTTNPEFTVELITDKNTYIDVKLKDTGMVCSSGGTGTEADPIIICNAEDLYNVRYDDIVNYALGKDIDLQCFSRQTEEGWEPIHLGIAPIRMDGRNHIIKNLYINRPSTDYVGLFENINFGSEIKNLGLVDINITGGSDVGGLSGTLDAGSVINCHSTGTVIGNSDNVGGLIGSSRGAVSNSYSTSRVEGTNIIGGLVGLNSGSEAVIENSYATGNIIGSNDNVGGLVGLNEENGTVYLSRATGNVSGENYYTGGLIGQNIGLATSSFATGNVSGLKYTGGLIGRLKEGTVDNCYATGDVDGDRIIGGLIGDIYTFGVVSETYSIGSVIGNYPVGGLIGYVEAGDISYSYYNIETSGQNDEEKGEPKTTEEMKQQSTYQNFNFEITWGIQEGVTYPYLINNPPQQ